MVGSVKYPWKRFWCPREGSLGFLDGGFLSDPESEYAKFYPSDAVPFEQISHLPCLALLGEPGIGKSSAMEGLRDTVQQTVHASGEALLYVNLNDYGDELRLINDVFETAEFRNWLSGTHCLHLFLDSLDECRIRISSAGLIIAKQLAQVKGHLGRLRLRIASRTADWPPTLNGSLPGLWGKDAFGAFELAPLRRKDVLAAAVAESLDADRFMAELRRTETVPLAIKPITLKFLLTVFKAKGQFPTGKRELYERGCLMLCEEANPTRKDLRSQGGTGRLSPEERMAVASRIAAVALFCRKPTINIGDLPPIDTEEEAPISSLVGGHESVGGTRVEVVGDAVREALGTGLFSSRGPERMGFAHQTYAEFLASRYLATREVTPDKVLSLVRHPEDPAGRIVPQLYETAAWIAGTNGGVLRAIAPVDPQVLLRGDAAALTEEDRQFMVDALLLALAQERVDDRDWDLHRHYSKLKHPGLADQLRAWIMDKNRHFNARVVAIHIAEECRTVELQSPLADMAMDQTETARLRMRAASAVGEIGDPDTRKRLLPLAMGQGGDDPDDNLKGSALRALWPGSITAETMFRNLGHPKRKNFYGAYMGFLTGDMVEHLGVADLPYALGWLRTLAGEKELDYSLDRVADEIVIRAWGSMDDPRVLDALAMICVQFLKHHHRVIHDSDRMKENSPLLDDPIRRRRLAAKVVEISYDQVTRFELVGRPPCLIRLEDFEWCVEQLRLCTGNPAEKAWAEIVWSLFCWEQPDSQRLDSVIDARGQSPVLRAMSELFFTPVEIESERAEKIRKDFYDSKKWSRKPRQRRVKPPPRQRIEHLLERSEKGEPQAWWLLLDEMTLEDTSTHYGIVPLDVRNLPGWERAEAATKLRLLAAAERFVRHGPVDAMKWLREPHTWSTFHIAAYTALLLLKNEAPEVYAALPSSVWVRQVATVLCSPMTSQEDRRILQHEEAALRCFQQAKSEFLFYLPIQIDAEDRVRERVTCIDKLAQCRDDDLNRVLHDKLTEAQEYWRVITFDQIAAILLTRGHAPTRVLLVDLVRSAAEGTSGSLERSKLAAMRLINQSPDASWPVIWPTILANRSFGRDFLMSVAEGMRHKTEEVASKLADDQLGDLYVWLAKEFPYSEDREHNGAYSPTRDDSVRGLRDGVLSFLVNRGTPGAISAGLPHERWARRTH